MSFMKFIRTYFLQNTCERLKSLLNRNVHKFIILWVIFFKKIFSPTLLLKACGCLGLKIILGFQDFFFAGNCIGSKTLSIMSWILQSYEVKSITESFWDSPWSTYLLSFLFQKYPAASFFKNNNCCFSDQANGGHHTNKFT